MKVKELKDMLWGLRDDVDVFVMSCDTRLSDKLEATGVLKDECQGQLIIIGEPRKEELE